MSKQVDIVDQAAQNVGYSMISRAKKGKIIGSSLLIVSVALLYIGFSNGGAFELSFGFLFLLYGLFRLFHIRRTQSIMREVQSEIAKLKEGNKRAGT